MIKKRMTTLPAWMDKQVKEILELKDWYRKYKPNQKDLTVSKKVMRELWNHRQVNGFVKQGDDIFCGSLKLKTIGSNQDA